MNSDETNNTTKPNPPPGRMTFAALVVAIALATTAVTALLVNMFTRKQEALTPFVRLVEVNERTTDPEAWGTNWPREYDSYKRTADITRTRYGGSEAMPQQRLDRDPWLRRMYAGYAFSIDFRDRRGHAYMLTDQEQTERVTKKPQPGACLHCHASATTTWRRLGLEAEGKSLDDVHPYDFAWPAVMKGFEKMGKMSYANAHAELLKTPDGTPAQAYTSTAAAGGGAAGTAVAVPTVGVNSVERRPRAEANRRPGTASGPVVPSRVTSSARPDGPAWVIRTPVTEPG
jgi:nitrite reductase (cytochrome c-552)